MSATINYQAIGLLMLFFFGLCLLALLWFAGIFSYASYQTYLTYPQESISGLNVDSPVLFNGVRVGRVTKVNFNPKNPRWVELELSVKAPTQITKGTVAYPATRGMSGLSYLALQNKTTNQQPLKILPGQPYPIIPSALSPLVRWDIIAREAVSDLQIIGNTISHAFTPTEKKSMKEAMLAIKAAAGILMASSSQLSNIWTSIGLAKQEIYPSYGLYTQIKIQLQKQFFPLWDKLKIQVETIFANLEDAAADIKENPALLITPKLVRPVGPGE